MYMEDEVCSPCHTVTPKCKYFKEDNLPLLWQDCLHPALP